MNRKGSGPYRVQSFDLAGLVGISDQTMAMHLRLYEGYVNASNELSARIGDILKDGRVDQEEEPAYAELTRRLGFEYNGMVLHEYYFGNLTKGGSGSPNQTSAFLQGAEQGFGSYETWKVDFTSVGKLRGVGWAICYLDPASGRLTNHWVSLHEHGHIAGFGPLLVMDVWEHAYLLDYGPSERAEYIDAFFANSDWRIVDERLRAGVPAPAGAARW